MTAEDIAQDLNSLLWSLRLYWLVLLLYGVAWLAYLSELRGGRWPAGKAAPAIWLVALGLHTLFLFLRSSESGWWPVVTGYDRIALVAWGLSAAYAVYERRVGNHILGLTVPLVVLLLGLIGQILHDPVPFHPPVLYLHIWYGLHAVSLLAACTLAAFALGAEWLPGLLALVTRRDPRVQVLVNRFRGLAGRLADRSLALALPVLLLAIGWAGLWNSAVTGTAWLGEWTGAWILLAALIYTLYYHARPGVGVRPRLLALLNSLGFLFLVLSLTGIPGQGLPGFPPG